MPNKKSDKDRIDSKTLISQLNSLIKDLKPYLEALDNLEKEKTKVEFLNQRNKYLSKSKETLKESKEFAQKAQRYYEEDKFMESNRFAKKAYRLADKSRKSILMADKYKQKAEGTYINPLKKYLTVANIVSLILTLFVIFILFLLTSPAKVIINSIFEIFYRYFGRYQTATFFLTGFAIFSICFIVGFVIWAINFVNKKKVNWWFVVTILAMVFIGVTGLFFVHMYTGQDNLNWKVRDSTMKEVGIINCSGASEVILSLDYVTCKMTPNLTNLSAEVNFYLNDKRNLSSDFTNLSFIAQSDVNYVAFRFSGINNSGSYTSLSTGSPYHFYTLEEYNTLKIKFLGYLAVILSLIFVTIPLIMNQLRNLHKSEILKRD